MSLKNKIVEYLKDNYPKIVHKGELGKMAVNLWGFENENMGRRCRELVSEGIIEPIPDDKGRMQYRYKPEAPKEEITTDYKALIQRTKLPIENRKDLQKGIFVYKVDPKHAISELRDPN